MQHLLIRDERSAKQITEAESAHAVNSLKTGIEVKNQRCRSKGQQVTVHSVCHWVFKICSR